MVFARVDGKFVTQIIIPKRNIMRTRKAHSAYVCRITIPGILYTTSIFRSLEKTMVDIDGGRTEFRRNDRTVSLVKQF